MRYRPLSITKTREKLKVVYRDSMVERVIGFVVVIAAFLSLIFAYLVSLNFVFASRKEVFWFLVLLIPVALSVYIALRGDRTRRIQGLDPHNNRIAVHTILKKWRWVEYYDSKNITVASPPHFMWFGFGRQVTIIYSEDNIFINSTTFGRYDLRSPFHLFGDLICEKEIKRAFNDYLESKS